MNKILNENLEEKNNQIDDLKKLYLKVKNSNKQYFNEMIQLKKDYSILEKICIFELVVILLLIYLMVIVL